MAKVKVQVKDLLAKDGYKRRFQEIMGKKAIPFMASLLNVVNTNDALSKCDPESIVKAAAVAATLDLPVDPNLGFAYIIPYAGKARFQIGYKAFIQLAQRSGFYQTINEAPIYEGELESHNRVTGEFYFDFTQKPSGTVIGYTAYIRLLNGFEKTIFMSIEDLYQHAARYSKSYQYAEKNKKDSLWHNDFDSMARKTVLKRILSKYGPLSINMQEAVSADNSPIADESYDPLKEPEALLPGGQEDSKVKYDIKGTAEEKWRTITTEDSTAALQILDEYKKIHGDKEVDFAWCVGTYEDRNQIK